MTNKRGLSNVIVTLIIIVISLIAVGLVWVVVQNLIGDETEEISLGFVTVDLEITEVKVQANDTEVKVKRKTGKGEISGLKFIVSDGVNTKVIDKKNVNLSQLEEKTFILTSVELGNIGFIKEISVAPVFKLGSGEEKIGNVVDSLSFTNKKVLKTLGAVSWWRFEGNARDEIGSNDGTLSGNVSFVDGKFGKALKDGSIGYVQVDPLDSQLEEILKTGSFSITFFWTPEKKANWFDVISFDQNYGITRFEHGNDDITNSGYWWGATNSVGTNNAITDPPFIPYGEEHHYVAICDRVNNKLIVYIDGEKKREGSICESWSTISNFKFFQHPLEEEILDEVMIFNKALSDKEVKALYELDLS